MKYFLSAVMAAGWLCLAAAAFAQSSTPVAPPSPAPAAPAVAPTANPPSSPSASGGKRAECVAASAGKQGQDRQDQMQLCLAQARVECLKQAIDQKVANAGRRDFVRNCMKEE
jgi:hypothetical protein